MSEHPDTADRTEVDDLSVERALRVGLEEFELDDEDLSLLGREGDDDIVAEEKGPVPVVAIIGRPNVGKSTLVNRILGRREAVVEDVPGVTRDRVAYDAEWTGTRFTLVDTGGWEVDATGIHLRVAEQAEIAIELADAVMFVVDATVGATDTDDAVVKLLRKSGKPVILVANKVDDPRSEADAAMLWSFGLGQPWPVSALHGRGSGDVLDALLAVLPTFSAVGEAYARGGPRRVALVGRPNVGKSTLLNALTGSARAIVSPIAGTTRDAVDEVVTRAGHDFRFVDTAGIRRKGKTKLMAEKLSVIMARKHLEAADVSLLVLDATDGVAALDANIGGYAHESGRSVIIVINKWDLVTHPATNNPTTNSNPNTSHPAPGHPQSRVPEPAAHKSPGAPSIAAFGDGWDAKNSAPKADPKLFEQQVRDHLKFLDYAPLVFVSATTGAGVEALFKKVELVARERRKRVTTGQMNRFLADVDFQRASVPMNRRVKIYYMTQAAVAPPTFVLFTDRDVRLHFAFERFLANQIRAAFGFIGAPIWFKLRPRIKKISEE